MGPVIFCSFLLHSLIPPHRCHSGLRDGAERWGGPPLLPSERSSALPLLPPEAPPARLPSIHPCLLLLTLLWAVGDTCWIGGETSGADLFNSCCRGLIYGNTFSDSYWSLWYAEALRWKQWHLSDSARVLSYNYLYINVNCLCKYSVCLCSSLCAF